MLFPKVGNDMSSHLHYHQFPQTPCLPEIGNSVIYRAWQEEGEGQFPIAKTKDWVEEDFGSLSERMAWATKWGFKGSAFVALCDIFLVKQITERKAQLARCRIDLLAVECGLSS